MEMKNVKERKIDILALWKSFINPKPEELSQEEIILNTSNLSQKQKEELVKALKHSDKTMNKLLESSYKTLNVKVETKNLNRSNTRDSVKLNEKGEEKELD